MEILLSMLLAFIMGVAGSVLDFSFELNFPQLGTILSVITMGGAIMLQNRRKK